MERSEQVANSLRARNDAGRRRRRWGSFAGALLLLPVLLLQELVFRAVFPTPAFANFNRVNYGPRPRWVKGPLRESINARYRYGSKPDRAEFVSSVNIYGFRDPQDWPLEKTPGRPRVMFIGDSFVEGLLSQDTETIPEVFAASAKAGGVPVEVMNLGVSGSGVRDYATLLRDAVPVFKPDVLVVVFYENDFPAPTRLPELSQPPRRARFTSAWTPRAYTVAQRFFAGRTLPRPRPGPTFPVYFKIPDPGNPLSNPAARAHFASFVEPELLKDMAEGVLSPWLMDHLANAQSALRAPLQAEQLVLDLRQFAARSGMQLFIGSIPHAIQVSDHYVPFAAKLSRVKDAKTLKTPEYQQHGAALAAACAQQSVPFVDLTPLLRDEEDRGNHLYWEYDTHMKAPGYALVAHELWKLYQAHRSP